VSRGSFFFCLCLVSKNVLVRKNWTKGMVLFGFWCVVCLLVAKSSFTAQRVRTKLGVLS